MTLVAEVKARISTGVPALAGAVEEAADLAELVRQNALPQKAVAAYVLPLGVNGGAGEMMTGAFIQPFNEVIGVLLIIQALGDATAKKALAPVDVLQLAICRLLCGWAPASGSVGVMNMQRARLVSVAGGTVFYQIDFSLQNQLRNI
jgi:hypothetical protein